MSFCWLPDDLDVLHVAAFALPPPAVHDRRVHVGRGKGVGFVEQRDDAEQNCPERWRQGRLNTHTRGGKSGEAGEVVRRDEQRWEGGEREQRTKGRKERGERWGGGEGGRAVSQLVFSSGTEFQMFIFPAHIEH